MYLTKWRRHPPTVARIRCVAASRDSLQHDTRAGQVTTRMGETAMRRLSRESKKDLPANKNRAAGQQYKWNTFKRPKQQLLPRKVLDLRGGQECKRKALSRLRCLSSHEASSNYRQWNSSHRKAINQDMPTHRTRNSNRHPKGSEEVSSVPCSHVSKKYLRLRVKRYYLSLYIKRLSLHRGTQWPNSSRMNPIWGPMKLQELCLIRTCHPKNVDSSSNSQRWWVAQKVPKSSWAKQRRWIYL